MNAGRGYRRLFQAVQSLVATSTIVICIGIECLCWPQDGDIVATRCPRHLSDSIGKDPEILSCFNGWKRLKGEVKKE